MRDRATIICGRCDMQARQDGLTGTHIYCEFLRLDISRYLKEDASYYATV